MVMRDSPSFRATSSDTTSRLSTNCSNIMMIFAQNEAQYTQHPSYDGSNFSTQPKPKKVIYNNL